MKRISTLTTITLLYFVVFCITNGSEKSVTASDSLTRVTIDPYRAPVRHNVTIEGEFFSSHDGVSLSFILYNFTDRSIEIEMEVFQGYPGTAAITIKNGKFKVWWIVPQLSLGEYYINVTDSEGSRARSEFLVVAETIMISSHRYEHLIGDTVTFEIKTHFKKIHSSIEIRDPYGNIYWDLEFTEDDFVKSGDYYVVPYYSQIDISGNQLKLPSDAPIGTWKWTWYYFNDEEISSGYFAVIPTPPKRLEIFLKEPNDGVIVNTIFNFNVIIHNEYGDPVPGAKVTFYVDGSSIGSSNTDSNGYAKKTYSGEAGNHEWYVTALKSSYPLGNSQIWSFTFLIKYTLTLVSENGYVSGGGQYDGGSTVSFKVSPIIIEAGSGMRYMFTGWTSDSPEGYSGLDNPATVMMYNDITEVANWTAQFLLTIDSPFIVEGEGWYDEGSTATLRAGSPQGFLVRRIFQRWSGDIQSDSDTVSITMDGPKTVVAEWATDYTQLYLVGGLASVVVVSAGALSIQRRRDEERRRERAKLKKTLVNELHKAEKAVQISSLASEHGAREEKVRQLMDEALNEGVISGRFTMDNRRFITKAIMERITTRARQSVEVISISSLGDEYGVSEELVRQLIDEALREGVLKGSYSKDGQRFITEAALKRLIKDKLRNHGKNG